METLQVSGLNLEPSEDIFPGKTAPKNSSTLYYISNPVPCSWYLTTYPLEPHTFEFKCEVFFFKEKIRGRIYAGNFLKRLNINHFRRPVALYTYIYLFFFEGFQINSKRIKDRTRHEVCVRACIQRYIHTYIILAELK